MQIEYKHTHINDPEGSFYTSELGEFLLLLPDVGLTVKMVKIIPPLKVLNEVLRAGKCDAGMSGFFEWSPIQIDAGVYEDFKKSLSQKLGASTVDFGSDEISLKKWMSEARSYFRKHKKA